MNQLIEKQLYIGPLHPRQRLERAESAARRRLVTGSVESEIPKRGESSQVLCPPRAPLVYTAVNSLARAQVCAKHKSL